MNTYLEHDQIKMTSLDRLTIVFITNMHNTYYKVMSFGIKNARSTYQRLMGQVFSKKIGKKLGGVH